VLSLSFYTQPVSVTMHLLSIKTLQLLFSTRVESAEDDPPLYKHGLKPIQAVCRNRVELLIQYSGKWFESSPRHCCPSHWHTFSKVQKSWTVTTWNSGARERDYAGM